MQDLITLDSNLFLFADSPEFLYQNNPHGESYDGSSVNFPLTFDHIRENDYIPDGSSLSIAKIAEIFYSAIFGEDFGKDHPAYRNLASLSYKGDALSFLSRPVVASFLGAPSLIIGSSSKTLGLEYSVFPLVKTEPGFSFKGTLIPRLMLSSVDVPVPGTTNQKRKIPILVFRANDITFGISVRTAKDLDYYAFYESWESKDIQQIGHKIQPLYGASANLADMFSPLFLAKKWDPQGLMIPVTNAVQSVVSYQDAQGKSQSFPKVVLTVDTTGMDWIPVKAYADGQDNVVPLSEVTTISCYHNHNASKDVIAGKKPESGKPWYLYIQGPTANPMHRPDHLMYTGFIPPKLKKLLVSQSQRINGGLPELKSVNLMSDKTQETIDVTPNYDDNPL